MGFSSKNTVLDNTNPENTASLEGKYLTFVLDDEIYGIEILKVREIIGIVDITSIPQSPEYLKGIINLRGKVIPVIDLRLKFYMPEVEYTHETCIIVVEVNATDLGIIVDTVSEVLDIKSNEIEKAGNLGNKVDRNFLLGLGKIKERIIILLDIDKILNTDEFLKVRDVSN